MRVQNLLSLAIVFVVCFMCLFMSNLQATTQTEAVANAPPIVQEVISDIVPSTDNENFDLFNIVPDVAINTGINVQADGQLTIVQTDAQSPAADNNACLNPGAGIIKAPTVYNCTQWVTNELFKDKLKHFYRLIEATNRQLGSGTALVLLL